MKRKRSLFLRYVMTYMAVSVVTISIFAVFLYDISVKYTQSKLEDDYRAMLERAGGTLDERLGNLYDLSVVLEARDATEVMRQMDAPVNGSSIPAINAYSRELQPYNYTTQFIKELILYFTKSGIFISSNSVGLYPNVYFDVVLRYTDMDFPAWREMVKAPQFMNYHPVFDDRNGERFVDVLLDLQPHNGGTDKVLMIARINGDEIIRGLESAIADGAVAEVRGLDGSLVYVSSPAILTGAAPKAEGYGQVISGGEKYVSFTRDLNLAQWQYTLLVPRNIFLAERQRFFGTLAILTLSVLLTGVIMSVLLSIWGMMPLRKLLNVFRPNEGTAMLKGANEYASLDAHIRGLIENNQNLQGQVHKYQELNRMIFLDRLLGSGFSSEEELQAIARHSGVQMDRPLYALAVFELVGYNNELLSELLQEMDTATIVITDFLNKHVDVGVFVHKVDFSHIALIFCLDERSQVPPIHSEVNNLKNAVTEKLHLKLKCAISGEVEDLNSLGIIYFSLCRSLKDADALPGEPAQILGGSAVLNESYDYSIDVERKLINYLLAGNEREAAQLLTSIFRENMEKNKLAMPYSAFLIHAVKGSLIRARDEIKDLDEEDNARLHKIIYLQNNLGQDAQWSKIGEAAALLCQAVQKKKNMRNSHLVERINSFIDANYQDGQLDLTVIAQEFMLTINYLSFFYKGITGETISGKIEKTRMNHAERLIREGGRTVKDIAVLVGYTNLNTFYKAFRRVYGISPTGYYDSIINA